MQALRSRYLRTDSTNLILRRYVARALLSTRLERALLCGSIDERKLALFSEESIDADEVENPKVVRHRLRAELSAVADASWDGDDPFVRNTAAIGDALDLDDVELELVRFALLLQNVKVLDSVSDMCNDSLSSIEAVSLLAVNLDADEGTVARAFGVEVASENEDGGPLDVAGRVRQYRLCQAMLARRDRALVVYDEVEDVISDAAECMHRGERGSRSIGFLATGS